MLKIDIILIAKDNYSYLVIDQITKQALVIDPTAAAPILAELNKQNLKLKFILNTHHHLDHTQGNLELKSITGAKIITSKIDYSKISGADISLGDKEKFSQELFDFQVLELPAHTLGHVGYYFNSPKALFCGDTLFSLGCGKLFEGTILQLYNSLLTITNLAKDSLLYPGHEYSLKNSQFAIKLEPNNLELVNRISNIIQLIELKLPTIPVTIAQELATNPFLRLDSLEIVKNLGLNQPSKIAVLAALRAKKDTF